MPDQEPKANGTGSSFMDAINTRVGKIAGVITGVVALVAAVTALMGGVQKLVEMVRPSKPVAASDCLDLKLGVQPTTVSVGKWRALQFDLTGRNTCKETLSVYVAFRSFSDNMRVEPFKSFDQAACRIDDADCWEGVMLDRGKPVNWKLTPPRLTQLSSLADPESMDVDWIVYKVGTKERLKLGKFPITVQRDAAP